jgi:hypothetical protein
MSGPAPLSYAQERMWFLNQLEPGSSMYSGVRATRWRGQLDLEALARTVGEILRRHEVLRTRFPLGETGPVQVAEAASPFDLPLVDLSAGGPASAMAEAQAWLRSEARRPFELTRDIPFRAALLRLGPDDHVLALTIHHIAFDRWSRSLLRGELGSLYTTFAAGRPSALHQPAMQYRDYARWQRERLASEPVNRALQYWRERLEGAPEALRLPYDRPHRGSAAPKARQANFVMSEGLVDALGQLSRSERVTLFMTLLAAFKGLLSRVTGDTDLVVGVPIAGRTRVELGNLIGCFTNTLVLRTDASGGPTFRELLRRVREVALGGYAHQELPFERLVRELRPERHLGRHPLFQVLFNYLDFPAEPINVPGVLVEELEAHSESALLDLGVDVRRAGGRLTCTFTCDADRFEESTVTGLARQYHELLEALAKDPNLRITAGPDAGMRPEPAQTERLIEELEHMTDEEAERLLAAELRSGNQ